MSDGLYELEINRHARNMCFYASLLTRGSLLEKG